MSSFRVFLGGLTVALCWPLGSLQAALDPTQPTTVPGQAAATDSVTPLVLQAILRGAAGTYAVINGQNLQVGAELAGARLVAIYPHAVLLERQGQQQLLRLVEPILKPSR